MFLKLASLSLTWHSTLWRSWFCWWRKSWHRFQIPPAHSKFLPPSIFPDVFPEALLSWHGWALQIPSPFGLGENWLGAVLRGWCRGPSPVSWPARIHKSFQLMCRCQGRGRGSRRAGAGGGGQEEAVESRQWDSGITSLWPISLRSALNASVWKQPNYCWPLHCLQNTAAATN